MTGLACLGRLTSVNHGLSSEQPGTYNGMLKGYLIKTGIGYSSILQWTGIIYKNSNP